MIRSPLTLSLVEGCRSWFDPAHHERMGLVSLNVKQYQVLSLSPSSLLNRYSMPSILVKRLPHAEGLPLPKRMTSLSSGCDVAAAVTDVMIIAPGDRALVPTGLVFEIPEGFEVQVRPRSGLAIKSGVTVLNAPGTIDADYRGEVKVILINLSEEPFPVRRGDRIAQLVPMRVALDLSFEETTDVAETDRGAGGFGHTGK